MTSSPIPGWFERLKPTISQKKRVRRYPRGALGCGGHDSFMVAVVAEARAPEPPVPGVNSEDPVICFKMHKPFYKILPIPPPGPAN